MAASEELIKYQQSQVVSFMQSINHLVVLAVSLGDIFPPDAKAVVHAKALQLAQQFAPEEPEPAAGAGTVGEALRARKAS